MENLIDNILQKQKLIMNLNLRVFVILGGSKRDYNKLSKFLEKKLQLNNLIF